jgi:hypothetical protein
MNLNITHAKYATAVVVGGIAAYQSYFHMSELIVSVGQDKYGAEWVLPLSVDGLALTATINMIQAKRAGRKPTVTSWLSLGVGVVASLAANVMSAWDGGMVARAVAAWPAIAVMLVIEMLARKGRKSDGPVDTSVLSDSEITDEALTEVAKPRRGRPVTETRALADHIWASNPTLTTADVANRLGISAGRLAEVMRTTSKV